MNFKKSKNVEGSIRIVNAKRTVCLMLVAMLFSTLNINAQSTPEPPTPPEAPSKQTSSSTSHTIDIDNDNDQTHNSCISFNF